MTEVAQKIKRCEVTGKVRVTERQRLRQSEGEREAA